MPPSPLQQLFNQHPARRREPLPALQPWLEAIDLQAPELGIPSEVAKALLFAESGGGYRTSSRGAQGPWQLTKAVPNIDPQNPELATLGALSYYKQLLDRFKGDHNSAVAAYNMGPTAFSRAKGELPLETQRHLARFWEHYRD